MARRASRTTTIHVDVARIVRSVVIGIVPVVALLSGAAGDAVLRIAALLGHW